MLTWLTYLIRLAPRRRAVLLAALAATVTVLGGIVFALVEHRSIGVGLYWAVVTATTVGYGDVVPENSAGRVVAVVVMLLAIPLLGAVFAQLAAAATGSYLRRILGMDRRPPEPPYCLVVGDHPSVPAVLAELVRVGRRVVLVSPDDPGDLDPRIHVVRGDPTDEATLAKAHPERADQALLAGSSDGDVLVAAVLLRKLAPSLPLVALAGSPAIATALRDLGVDQTVSLDGLLAHTLAKSLEAPHAGELLLRLLGSETYELAESSLPAGAEGRPLSELRRSHPGLLLGIARGDAVHLGVEDDPTLAPGDRVLELRALSHEHRHAHHGLGSGRAGPLPADAT